MLDPTSRCDAPRSSDAGSRLAIAVATCASASALLVLAFARAAAAGPTAATLVWAVPAVFAAAVFWSLSRSEGADRLRSSWRLAALGCLVELAGAAAILAAWPSGSPPATATAASQTAWLVGAALVLAGVAVPISAGLPGSRIPVSAMVDAAVLALAIVGLVIRYTITPAYTAAPVHHGFIGGLVVACLDAVLVLVCCVLLFVLPLGRASWAWRLLLAGLMVLLFSGLFVAELAAAQHVGLLAHGDVLQGAGLALLGLTGLVARRSLAGGPPPAPAPLIDQDEDDRAGRWQQVWHFVLPAIALPLAGWLLYAESMEPRADADDLLEIVLLAVMAALLTARQYVHLMQVRRHARRRAALIKTLTGQNRRLDSLLDASRAMSSSLVVDEVLAALARKAAGALQANDCVIFVYDPASDTLTARAFFENQISTYDSLGIPFPLATYPLGRESLASDRAFVELLSDPAIDPESRASMEEWGELSCLTVPLRFRGEPMGILVVTEAAFERRYTPDELALAEALGEQAAAAIHNALLHERLAERACRERLVNELSLKLSSSLDVDQVLGAAAHRIAQVLNVACCHVYTLEDEAALVCRASACDEALGEEREGHTFALADRPAAERALLTRAPVTLSGATASRADAAELAVLRAGGAASLLIVPLVERDRVIGTVELATATERAFVDDDLATATALAGVVALALANAQLYRDQSARAQRLASLLDTSRAITSTLDLDEVLNAVAERAAAALGSSECIIYGYDAAADALTSRALYQVAKTDYADLGTSYPLDECPSDRAILQGRELRVETLSDPLLSPEVREAMTAWGERTLLNVPLVFGDQPLGLLVLIETERERVFTADELELAAGLGEQAAAAISNARMVAELRLRTEETALLNEVARASAGSLELAEIAAAVMEPLRRLWPLERATLLLRRDAGGPLDIVFTTEARSELAGLLRSGVAPSFMARLAAEQVVPLVLPTDLPLSGRTPSPACALRS
jgi:GAF domain-containing protein